jgi:hypothetical protein
MLSMAEAFRKCAAIVGMYVELIVFVLFRYRNMCRFNSGVSGP